MRKRLVSALLILAVGLLPGVPAVACPSGGAEAASHAHADHSLPQSGHHHPAGAALHDDAAESSPALDPGSPPEEPSEHSGPACCRRSPQAAMSAVWQGVRVRTVEAVPAPAVLVLIAIEPLPTVVWRDPRTLHPDERRSPYVRNRAPLLI